VGLLKPFKLALLFLTEKCKEQKPYIIKHNLTIVEAHHHLDAIMA
jgi:hypothetical protein